MADAVSLVEIVGKESVSGPAGVAAGALSAVEAAAGKAGGAFASLASTVVKTAAAVATLSATGIIAGLTSATTAAAGFEKQMSAVGAVSGASAQQMKDLSALALKLGADTSFSASESAQGIGELVKAGVSIADVMGGAAKASLDLAAAGGVDVATAAEIASNAMNVFSIKGKDMAHVADEIAGAANASAIDVNDYKFSLAAAGSVAATVGINFDDLSTAIAVMGQAGIKGSDAGTSLKTMLLNLTPSTKAQIAEAKELGIVTADGANKFFDAQGKAKSMAEIAGVLQDATKGLTEQQRLQALQTLFGTDAIRAAAIMAKAGAGGFNEMATAIGKVSAADVANTRLDNLAGSIEKFKGSAETAAITVGQHLTPPLRRLVDIATDLVNKSLPDLDRFGTVLGTTFDRLIDRAQHLGPHLGAVRDILDGIGGRAGQGLEAARQGISHLVTEFEKLVEVVRPTVATLLDMGRTAGPMVQRFAEMALPVLKMVGQYLMDYVINQVQFLTTYVLPAFYDVAVQTFGFFRDVGPTLAHIAGVLREQLGVTLIWLADEAWPNLLSIVRQTVEWFNTTLLPLIPSIADALRVGLGQALYWLATVGWPALLSAATTAITWIQSTGIPAVMSLVDWLGPKLSGVLTWVTQTGWPALLSAGAAVSDWATGTAIPALTNLVDWLGPKVSAAVGWLIDTGGPALLAAGTAVTDWVTGTAVPALSSLWDWLSPKLSAALGWLTETGWPTFVTAATAVSDWITQTAIPALTPLVAWLNEKLGTAVSWLIETGWPTFVTAATAASDWMTQTAVPALSSLWSWLEEKTRPAVQWFIDTGWPDLQAAGQTVVQMWTDLSTWTADFFAKLEQRGVLTDLTQAFDALWDAGKILVETFWPQMIGDDGSGAKGAFTATDVFVTLIKGASSFLLAFATGVEGIAKAFKWLKDEANSLPDWIRDALRAGSGLLGPAGGIVNSIVQGSSQPATGGGRIDNSSRSSFVQTAYPALLQAAGGNKDLAEMMAAAAISENGDVGKGGDFVGNNFFGIKGKGPTGKSNVLDTWESVGGQRVNQKAEFAAYDSPVEGFQGFLQFLRANPLYKGALDRYEQSGDASALFHDINAVGYATNPAWADTIDNIRRNQVAPITSNLTVADMVGTATKTSGRTSLNLNTSSFPIGNQFELGLPRDEAMAACGPAAVAIFEQMMGRTPNAQEVMRIAAKNGWTAAAGMGGPQAFMNTLTDLAIEASADFTPTQQEAAAAVSGGHGVAFSTAGGAGHRLSEGHYFVAQGYDPASGQFDFGETAGTDPNTGAPGAIKGSSRYLTYDQVVELAGPVQALVTLMGGAAPVANEVAGNVGALGQAAQAATPPVRMLGTTFDVMGTRVASSASLLGDDLVTTMIDAAGNVVKTTTDMQGHVIDQVARMKDGALIQMNDFTTHTSAALSDAADTITTTMTDASGDVIQTVTDLSGAVVAQTVTMVDGVGTAAQGMGAGMVDAATQARQDLLAEMEATRQQATAAGTDIGTAAGGGIAEGLGQTEDDIRQALGDAVGGALDDLSRSFEIHSPSGRTRREIGQPLGHGIALGIDDMQGHVNRAMRDVVALDGLGSNGRLSGSRGADGGVDPDALAKAIARELAVMPRGHSITVNGSDKNETADEVMRRVRREDSLTGVRR